MSYVISPYGHISYGAEINDILAEQIVDLIRSGSLELYSTPVRLVVSCVFLVVKFESRGFRNWSRRLAIRDYGSQASMMNVSDRKWPQSPRTQSSNQTYKSFRYKASEKRVSKVDQPS